MNAGTLSIRDPSKLASLLGTSEASLWRIANSTNNLYRQREEPKESGGFRTISAPMRSLKNLQRKLHRVFASRLDYGPHSHYGVRRKSNITNALRHSGKSVIFTCDLKSFFPSVRPERVREALVREQGCSSSVATLITKLVTYDHQLPQGAPTSADIANIATMRLQRRLRGLARQWGLDFSIYADDITFSGNQVPDGFVDRAKTLIRDEGFSVHPDKGGVFDKSKPQIVTGINLAHGVTVGAIKRRWRAKRNQEQTALAAGVISFEEAQKSEARYVGRLAYAAHVARRGRRP